MSIEYQRLLEDDVIMDCIDTRAYCDHDANTKEHDSREKKLCRHVEQLLEEQDIHHHKGIIYKKVYLTRKQLKNIGCANYDRKKLAQLWNEMHTETYLNPVKNVGRSYHPNGKWKIYGEESRNYALLAIPFLVPALVYIHKICDGDMFIQTTTK